MFLSSMFCCGVKQTVEDNCILAHSILKMLEIPFQKLKFKQIFREHAPPPREILLPVKNLSPPVGNIILFVVELLAPPLCVGIRGFHIISRGGLCIFHIKFFIIIVGELIAPHLKPKNWNAFMFFFHVLAQQCRRLCIMFLLSLRKPISSLSYTANNQ
jgi:hypothetical protein